MKPLVLSEAVVLITGASSGIGYELALEVATRGGRVVLVARRKDRLNQLAEKIGTKALVMAGDITQEEFCERAVKETIQYFGRLDVLINNAGVSMNAQFLEARTEVFRQMMEINYFGSLYMSRAAALELEKNQGSLIFISSVVGKRGFPTRSGYSAAKFAVQGLFESLRAEWAGKNIHVGVVSPGFTDTEIRSSALTASGQPLHEQGKTRGRIMPASVAAQKILQAILKRQRDTVLTPEGKLIVAINRFFPKLADQIAARIFA